VGVGGSPRNGRRASGLAAPRLVVRQGVQRSLADLPQAPLDALRAGLKKIETERPEGLPPFCGGYVGYLGWPAAAWTEPPRK